MTDQAPAPLQGPLVGVRVLELAGIGPGPFAAMMLADAGADVLRIDRPDSVGVNEDTVQRFDILNRGKRSVAVDLKSADGLALVLDLVERADVLIEGFRPGVTERLGLGPEVCLERNPRLVYTRMTGWGQDGPLAQHAGHDINYIGVAGALHPIGRADSPPVPPLNLVGDFGGGALFAAYGVACALLERERSGRGQVIDAAIVDGTALLTSMMHGFAARGLWTQDRAANLLDSGAPFYDVYETADGRYLAVGAIETRFYAELVDVLGLPFSELPDQLDQSTWPDVSKRFADVIATRTLDEWLALAGNRDVCLAPAVPLLDARDHPHMAARSAFVEVDGVRHPAPAPRFSRTPQRISRGPSLAGRDGDAALADWLAD